MTSYIHSKVKLIVHRQQAYYNPEFISLVSPLDIPLNIWLPIAIIKGEDGDLRWHRDSELNMVNETSC